MRIQILLISLLLLNSKFSAAAPESSAMENKTLVIVGDSLTEGLGVAKERAYPALLEKKLSALKLKSSWRVVSAGVSGATSASAAQRVQWQLKAKPDLLLLALGANDGLRGLKTEETKKNLAVGIEAAQKAKVPVILAGMMSPPNYGADYSERFKKIYSDLAKQYKIPLIPFLLEGVAGEKNLNQADGIHPNEKGHEVIAGTVLKTIEKELRGK